VPYRADHRSPLENASRQPLLSAMALGPPVPPPLFTVLRA
jgi:hypothetical protein